jgi:hypothetical protein
MPFGGNETFGAGALSGATVAGRWAAQPAITASIRARAQRSQQARKRICILQILVADD